MENYADNIIQRISVAYSWLDARWGGRIAKMYGRHLFYAEQLLDSVQIDECFCRFFFLLGHTWPVHYLVPQADTGSIWPHRYHGVNVRHNSYTCNIILLLVFCKPVLKKHIFEVSNIRFQFYIEHDQIRETSIFAKEKKRVGCSYYTFSRCFLLEKWRKRKDLSISNCSQKW